MMINKQHFKVFKYLVTYKYNEAWYILVIVSFYFTIVSNLKNDVQFVFDMSIFLITDFIL